MGGRISTSEVRKRMSEALDILSEPDRWIIITRHGEPVAAMVSINLIWSLLEAANGGGGRLRYTAPDGIGTAIETGSARAPEHKSMFGPRGAPPPLQIEIADAPMPDVDELLRRIDSLQGDMRAEPFAS